ncbi:hypothetical protein KSP39_PZI003206 [Platanthera zijinensis]|uniref:Uncharacterized protein n=1 Tax=Platanthera zijinensis TaxID=2320716 RepID=A0AAP0BWR4_9ASPA
MPEIRKAGISKEPPKRSKMLAEAAGGTAAGCAAVVCCCPCGILGLLVLSVARITAGVGRRVARKKMKATRPTTIIPPPKSPNRVSPASMTAAAAEMGMALPGKSPAAEVSEMEEKMWAQFAGAGFWRSLSQRE